MTIDLEDVTDRLTRCLASVASTVSDEPPEWDATGRQAGPTARMDKRVLVLMAPALAVAAALVVVALTWSSGQATPTVQEQLISAIRHTISAGTARVRITAAATGGEPSTGTGVVDFATPAAEFSYSSGFGVVLIGNQIWDTGYPIKHLPDGATRWRHEGTPPSDALGRALQPDTTPSALLTALRSATKTVSYLGTGMVNGSPARHYRATVGTVWRADVWVAGEKLLEVSVHGPSGTSTVLYYDFGVAAAIHVP
jgi:hypothetical protein